MKKRAYTLVELMVAMLLMGLVLAAAGTALLQNLNNEVAYRQQNQVQQNARTAINLIADDMRGAVRNPALRKPDGTAVAFASGASTAPTNTVRGIGSAPTYTAPLYFDIRDDGAVSNSGNPRRVRYWIDGSNNLRREIVAGTVNATSGNDTTTAAGTGLDTNGVVIARNINSFTTSKPNGDNIVRVVLSVQLVGDANQASSTTSRVTFQVDVSLRNNLF